MTVLSLLRSASAARLRRERSMRFLGLAILLQSAPVLAVLPLPTYDPAKVANPSATVSAGTTAMGATSASFSVGADGSANYSIPLKLVPGHTGFQPDLSIDFSSSSGNGTLGVGFQLSGVGSIHRCAKTLHEDSEVRGVQLDEKDRFCLNGLKLVAVSGSYGLSGTEYRTAPDTHVRVRSYVIADGSINRGPTYFVVDLPNGQSQYYGLYKDGAKDTITVTKDFSRFNVGWPLTYAKDGNGNLISYHYLTRSSSVGNEKERWLSEIKYGGSTVSRHLTFGYEDRPDRSYGWRYGQPREASKRLRSIEHSLTVNGALKRVRKYAFDYVVGSLAASGTGRSKLARITECGSSDGECLRPTEFSWLWGGSGFQSGVAQGMALPASAETTIIAADLDGDGRTDLAYPNPGTCKWRFAYGKPLAGNNEHYPQASDTASMDCDPLTRALAFDYDLNGTTDLLTLQRTFGTSAWYEPLLLNRDRTWTKVFTTFVGPMAVDPNFSPDAAFAFGDFNGDGLQDVLEHEPGGPTNPHDWRLRLRTGKMGNVDGGNILENKAWVADNFRSIIDRMKTPRFGPPVLVMDVNGDGLDEVLPTQLLGDGAEALQPYDPFLAREAETSRVPSFPLTGEVKLLDLNADGLTDIVTNVPGVGQSPGTSLYYLLNTGAGFTNATLMQGITLSKMSLEVAQVVDVNRDGRDELLVPRGHTGASFEPLFSGMDLIQGSFDAQGVLIFARSTSPVVTFNTALTRKELKSRGIRVVDADADGQSDLMVLNRPGGGSFSNQAVLHKSANHMGDRLIEIRDGRQITDVSAAVVPSVMITYAPLSDSGVHDVGNCTRVEFMTCASGSSMFVVKKVQLDAGLNANGEFATLKSRLVSEYSYTGARFDRVTRKFAGFSEILKTTYGEKGAIEIGRNRTRSFYTNTSVARPPMLDEEWVFTTLPGNRESLTQTKFLWNEKSTSDGATYFQYPVKKTVSSFEFARLLCQYSDCLAYDNRSNVPIQNKVAHRTEETRNLEVDNYGNVGLKIVAITGPEYSHRSETKTVPNVYIDDTTWLLRRPQKVTTTNKGYDGETKTRTAEYTYHSGAAHRIKQEKLYGATTGEGPVLTNAYDYYTSGLISRITATDLNSGQQRERAFAYDFYGFLHAERNGLGHTRYSGYDPGLGVVKVSVDANQLRTDLTYDSLGRLVKSNAPGSVETEYSYALIQVGSEHLSSTSTSNSTGGRTFTIFDRNGRELIVGFMGFDGWYREKKNEYDARGRLISSGTYSRTNTGEPTYYTQYEYDNLGRMLKRIEPHNAVTRWEYDKLKMTEINSRGHKKSVTLDQRSRKVRSVDGVGSVSEVSRSYGYTPFDALSRTQVEGNPASESTYQYNELGGLVSQYDRERGLKTFERNAFGEVTESVHGEGTAGDRRTVYVMDSLGRVVRSEVADGSKVRSITERAYDSVDGRILLGGLLRAKFTDHVAGGSTHTTEYFFDELARLSRTDYTVPSISATPAIQEKFSVSNKYDLLNRLESLTYPLLAGQSEATRIIYDYADPLARNGSLQRVRAIESLQGAPAKTTLLWTAEATDEQDRLSKFMQGSVHTQNVFDWRGALLSTQMRNDSNDDDNSDGLLAMMQFGYDGEGNLIRRADDMQPAVEHFEYDALDRLRRSSTKNTVDPLTTPDDMFFYDRLGNLTGSTRRGNYTFDLARPSLLLTASGGMWSGQRIYSYDYFGNQIGRPEGTVEYNDFNLPVRMANNAGVTTATFVYDANGMRVRKTSSAGTITYVPGLYERHEDIGSSSKEHRFIVQGTGATLRYQHDGRRLTKLPTLFSHGDSLGSTSLVTQNDFESAGGFRTVIKEKRSYESFGLPRNPNWMSADVFGDIQPALLAQGYTGHDEDRELGTVNMKGRIYDPKLGRFLTPDPFLDGANPTQRWNRYAYVSNNPVSATDPTGFLRNSLLEDRVAARMRQFSGVAQTIDGGATTFTAEPVVVDQGSINPGKEMMDSADRSSDWGKRSARCEAHGCSEDEWEEIREEFLERWDDPVESKENVSGKDTVKELVPDVAGGVSGKEADKMDGALAFNEKGAKNNKITAGCAGTAGDQVCTDFLNAGPLYTPEEWAIRELHELLYDIAQGTQALTNSVAPVTYKENPFSDFRNGATIGPMSVDQIARFHGVDSKDITSPEKLLEKIRNPTVPYTFTTAPQGITPHGPPAPVRPPMPIR